MASLVTDKDLESPKVIAQRKWRLLANIFKAVCLFRTQEAKTMLNIEELIEEIKSTPVKLKLDRQISLSSEIVDEHKLREKFFGLIRNSHEDDLLLMKELVESNPRRYTMNQSHPDSFINKSYQDTRPIYEASRLGYAETVKFLLKNGADPHLLSGKDVNENSLEVACRWRHTSVVNVLLQHSKWNAQDLKKAMKNTSDHIHDMLCEKIKSNKNTTCACQVF